MQPIDPEIKEIFARAERAIIHMFDHVRLEDDSEAKPTTVLAYGLLACSQFLKAQAVAAEGILALLREGEKV